jgi:LPXTG-motif cell wall-anchored protein
MSKMIRTSLAVSAVMLFLCGSSFAAIPVPEIDPSMGAGGLALLGGVILVLRGRRK